MSVINSANLAPVTYLNMTNTHADFDSCSLDRIEAATQVVDSGVIAHFKGLTLTSHFQPIFSLAHKRPVGYEALLRATNREGNAVSPLAVFNLLLAEQETVYLDRLCRNLHLRNFLSLSDDTCWLFLNVNPMVTFKGKRYGAYFAELLSRYQMPAHRVVIEILEESIQDEALLGNAVSYYKELGCLIAIDDFGAGHSNFDRIWSLSPQIVKLDRSIIVQAANNHHVRRVLPNLINLIHESGSLSLMEGVETEQEALIAMDSGIDFIQGYYFSKPVHPALRRSQNLTHIPALYEKFRQFTADETKRYHAKLQDYVAAFKNSVRLIERGLDIRDACADFINQPCARRCYLLNHTGSQLGGNITATGHNPADNDPRFLPTADTRDANWSRRHYFRRAMSNQGEVQISRPYLSITGANMCVTLSVQIVVDHEIQVFCSDIDWNDEFSF